MAHSPYEKPRGNSCSSHPAHVLWGKFYIQLVKRTRGRNPNFTDLVKKHYLIKTHIAIE